MSSTATLRFIDITPYKRGVLSELNGAQEQRYGCLVGYACLLTEGLRISKTQSFMLARNRHSGKSRCSERGTDQTRSLPTRVEA